MLHPHNPPTHPGEILREDVLPAMGLSIAQAARDMKISRQMLHKILKEEVSVTAEMAVRLGKFCGNGPDLWLNMQTRCDLWKAEQRLAKVIKKIPTHTEASS